MLKENTKQYKQLISILDDGKASSNISDQEKSKEQQGKFERDLGEMQTRFTKEKKVMQEYYTKLEGNSKAQEQQFSGERQ